MTQGPEAGPHPAPHEVTEAFRKQAEWCRRLASPYSAQVLDILAEDLAADGVLAAMTAGWPGDPVADALSLRVLGALHALVLTGAAPELAAITPPHATGDTTSLAATLRGTLQTHRDFIAGFLASPPQTNEIGRAAVLLGGFMEIAQATQLPLRLLEIGASAGLNLIWDRYRYRLAGRDWGDAASPITLAPRWEGTAPPVDAPLRVAARAACDLAPVDLENAEARLRLRAFVWPEQADRLARLDQAIALARQAGYRVDAADAGAWVAQKLSVQEPRQVTVLYHSIMWHYMPQAKQHAITGSMQAAGARSSAECPLAWLRLEFDALDAPPVLRLTLWPGGEDRLLARAHPHGSLVHWLGAAQTGTPGGAAAAPA